MGGGELLQEAHVCVCVCVCVSDKEAPVRGKEQATEQEVVRSPQSWPIFHVRACSVSERYKQLQKCFGVTGSLGMI